MVPNIILIGYTPSRHLFNPITMSNSARTIYKKLFRPELLRFSEFAPESVQKDTIQ